MRTKTLRTLFGAAACAALLVLAGTAWALTAQEAASRFADEYGVRVLKTEPSTLHGRNVFLLTVMNPGGNFNEAFQVSTVAVDAETGTPVSAFSHRPSGLDGNEAPRFDPNRQPTESARPGVPVWR